MEGPALPPGFVLALYLQRAKIVERSRNNALVLLFYLVILKCCNISYQLKIESCTQVSLQCSCFLWNNSKEENSDIKGGLVCPRAVADIRYIKVKSYSHAETIEISQ